MKKLVFSIVCVCLVVIAGGIFFFLQEKETIVPAWTPQNALHTATTTCPSLPDTIDTPVLRNALRESISYYKGKPQRKFTFGARQYTAGELITAYQAFHSFLSTEPTPTVSSIHQYLCTYFEFYASAAPSVLFTGYYEPLLQGAREKSSQFRFPLYSVPDDLVQVRVDSLPLVTPEMLPVGFPALRGRVANRALVPYYTRSEIDLEGALAGKDLELLWVDDEIDLFFLHIQGSGIVQLPDKTFIRVGYADKNGHPYRAIGKLLIDEGTIARTDMSMQRLKQYLREHPAEVQRILSFNPSYVFFRLLTEPGPVGSIGRPLSPMHSIATDSSLFPEGALALLSLSLPLKDTDTSPSPQHMLVLNQDTGGAIRGPGRVDLFTGHGTKAEFLAGHLKNSGSIMFLGPLTN